MGFSSPPSVEIFDRSVWDLVSRIPVGKVVTYGQIARCLPTPAGMNLPSYEVLGPRWVGAAMARCPDEYPWQRVVNAQGKISQRPGAGNQKELLQVEGVVFKDNGSIDLKLFAWTELR